MAMGLSAKANVCRTLASVFASVAKWDSIAASRGRSSLTTCSGGYPVTLDRIVHGHPDAGLRDHQELGIEQDGLATSRVECSAWQSAFSIIAIRPAVFTDFWPPIAMRSDARR
jgi:hypothetical protein